MTNTTATTVPTMNVDTLSRLLQSGEPVTVLDVRRTEDRAEWAIPGSVHIDAYERLKANDPGALDGLELPGARPVITVCAAGRTSLTAAELLRERGVDAISLEGGMKAWSLAWNSADVSVPGSAARVIQVRRTGKGCLSYLIGCDGEAVVIDASVAPEVYEELAGHHGWKITAAIDTHVHADHLSRSRSLAERTGATLRMPDQDRVTFPFTPLRDGDAISIGSARLEALRAPGHTFESTCYLLDGRALFTGDTLFLAGVGRPDLEADAEEARERAAALHRSLQRLLRLDPETIVLPGHVSEPVGFDGRPLSATLGEARSRGDLLRLDEETFVSTILSRIPPTPPNHQRIVALNEAGLAPEGDATDLEAGANRCAVS